MTTTQHRLHVFGWCLLAGAATAPVHAQVPADRSAQLEEIVVTAERRSTDLQKVALSVTAISGDDIERSGNTDIAQVLQGVPGLVMQNISGGNSTMSVQGSGGPPNIAMRGLGTDGPNRAGAVAVYEDGVLMTGGGSNIYDMNRVEVLRGPQGTLYGRGATGGAVNFITNDPTQTMEAFGRVQFGSYDLIATQGVLNVPLADSLAVRATFNQTRHNGYFNNGQSDQDDINARVKVRYKPNDDVSLTFGTVFYKSSAIGPGEVDISANPAPGDWYTALPGGTSNPITYKKFFADLEANLGFASLTYIGAYQTSHSYFSTYCGCFAGGTYAVVDSPYNKDTTHELRLASNGDSALKWVGGAYYYHNQMQQQFRLSTTAPAVGQADSPFTTNLQHYSPTSLGVFGEATYAIVPAYRVTAGVRETFDHLNQDQYGVGMGTPVYVTTATQPSDTTHIRHFDWKLRGEADLSTNNLLYAMASTGYRPGAVVQGQVTENETVHAYEVGSKNRIGNSMTLNIAVFYNDYSGFQNVLSVPDPVTLLVTTKVIGIPAKFYGGEVEFVSQLSPNDKLTLAPAYVHAKYADSCLVCSPQLLTDGKDVPHAPELEASGSYQHAFVFSGGARLTWDVDAHYQSKSFTDFDSSNYPAPNARFVQGAYTIANSSLTFAPGSDRYSISLYSKNITNKIYKVAAANGVAGSAFFVNDPRTWGVMFSAKL